MATENDSRSTSQQEAEPLGFEASLRAAEQSVKDLESGQLDLDAALSAYESGVRMLARCQGLLEAAERRVSLVKPGDPDGSVELVPFDPGSENG
jgi:exodeoxyribonuclease VII small subunit